MSEQKGTYTVRRFHDPLDDLLDRPVAFNPAFKRITGSTVAALMLSQAWYWSKRTSDEDGWFYKTQIEWEEETGLTRSEQETARKNLEEKGLIEIKLAGVPARLYYRIFKDEIYTLLGVQFAETLQTSLQESSTQVSGNPANIKDTEITTETTSETTPRKKVQLPPRSGVDWQLAGGVEASEIARLNEKEQRERAVADFWEKKMGYNPLPWWSDKGLSALLRFLLTKTSEEMELFIAWSKRPFSAFGPEKAREKPLRVIELWPQAFVAQEAEPSYYKRPAVLDEDESNYVIPD